MVSELFLREKKRYKELWEHVTRIYKENRGRYMNKNDVLEEALGLLEEKLVKEK